MLETLTELLAELEAAVRANNRPRAMQLEQTILQRLVAEAADHVAIELRVRELMQQFAQTPQRPTTRGAETFEVKGTITRGGPALTSSAPTDGIVYPVWFGTNRQPQGAQVGSFGGARHNQVTRGRIDVHVPEAHRFGETRASFWTRLKKLDWHHGELRIQQRARLERDAFYAEIHTRLDEARQSGEAAHALFFIHGYNVAFDDAAIRAAQIGYDLKAPATAFFSWPSRGRIIHTLNSLSPTSLAYPADEASIEASERAITDFLIEFATQCQADKIHVIAHSMGNRGFLRALQRIEANAVTRGQIKFGQIFLAAPDVDRDLFLDLAQLYANHAERTTLYASNGDLPVHRSAIFHDAPRAGYFKPYTVAPGLIDTVAVPDFDIDLLGHSYFAQAEALLHDIYDLMRNNQNPASRQRIQADFADGQSFWKLRL